jgi:hypothetical protein
LKKFMGRAGNGSRNLGCRNIYTPSSTATTWNGVTYRIIAVTKQKLMKIAVALYHTTATEYYTKLVEIRLVDPMEKKSMESSEEDGKEAWVIQTL